jgi:hypothetical protein
MKMKDSIKKLIGKIVEAASRGSQKIRDAAKPSGTLWSYHW